MPSTNGHGPKRAVLYARVSTDEQARSGYSLAQQIEALRDYAAREGYEVLEEVQDPGQSGASLERPGMDRVQGPRGRRRRLRGAGARPGPLRPRARVPLPPTAGVRGARDEDPRPQRPRRRQPGGRAHGRHPRPARQVRAREDRRDAPGEGSCRRHERARCWRALATLRLPLQRRARRLRGRRGEHEDHRAYLPHGRSGRTNDARRAAGLQPRRRKAAVGRQVLEPQVHTRGH